jgi:radical SAM protein with 4Fe4S-binding SPASM domain
MTTNIHKCKKPWNDLIILPTGNCINCLFQDRNHHLGNVNNQSIKYVWNSDALRDNREKMLNGEIPDICKTGINKCEFL